MTLSSDALKQYAEGLSEILLYEDCCIYPVCVRDGPVASPVFPHDALVVSLRPCFTGLEMGLLLHVSDVSYSQLH